MRIGVLGATGPAGAGLAARLADVGYDVLMGRVDLGRSKSAIDELAERWGDRTSRLIAATNADATDADVVVLATKWDGIIDTAAEHAAALDGRIVVSMANGLRRTERGFEAIVPETGSIAVGVQLAAPGARVVAAYHHLPAGTLGDLDEVLEGDALICGDDEEAVEVVVEMTDRIPDLRPVDVGPLANAAGLEALTATLVHVNVRHRTHTTIRLLGL